MNEFQAALLDIGCLLTAFGVWRIAFILSNILEALKTAQGKPDAKT
jgi:hypothetical protein